MYQNNDFYGNKENTMTYCVSASVGLFLHRLEKQFCKHQTTFDLKSMQQNTGLEPSNSQVSDVPATLAAIDQESDEILGDFYGKLLEIYGASKMSFIGSVQTWLNEKFQEGISALDRFSFIDVDKMQDMSTISNLTDESKAAREALTTTISMPIKRVLAIVCKAIFSLQGKDQKETEELIKNHCEKLFAFLVELMNGKKCHHGLRNEIAMSLVGSEQYPTDQCIFDVTSFIQDKTNQIFGDILTNQQFSPDTRWDLLKSWLIAQFLEDKPLEQDEKKGTHLSDILFACESEVKEKLIAEFTSRGVDIASIPAFTDTINQFVDINAIACPAFLHPQGEQIAAIFNTRLFNEGNIKIQALEKIRARILGCEKSELSPKLQTFIDYLSKVLSMQKKFTDRALFLQDRKDLTTKISALKGAIQNFYQAVNIDDSTSSEGYFCQVQSAFRDLEPELASVKIDADFITNIFTNLANAEAPTRALLWTTLLQKVKDIQFEDDALTVLLRSVNLAQIIDIPIALLNRILLTAYTVSPIHWGDSLAIFINTFTTQFENPAGFSRVGLNRAEVQWQNELIGFYQTKILPSMKFLHAIYKRAKELGSDPAIEQPTEIPSLPKGAFLLLPNLEDVSESARMGNLDGDILFLQSLYVQLDSADRYTQSMSLTAASILQNLQIPIETWIDETSSLLSPAALDEFINFCFTTDNGAWFLGKIENYEQLHTLLLNIPEPNETNFINRCVEKNNGDWLLGKIENCEQLYTLLYYIPEPNKTNFINRCVGKNNGEWLLGKIENYEQLHTLLLNIPEPNETNFINRCVEKNNGDWLLGKIENAYHLADLLSEIPEPNKTKLIDLCIKKESGAWLLGKIENASQLVLLLKRIPEPNKTKLINMCIEKESGAWLLGKIENAYLLADMLSEIPEPNKTKLIALCIKKESGAWLLGKIENAYLLADMLSEIPEPNKTKLIALCIKKESGAWLLGKIENTSQLVLLLKRIPEPNKTKLSTLCIEKESGAWLLGKIENAYHLADLLSEIPEPNKTKLINMCIEKESGAWLLGKIENAYLLADMLSEIPEPNKTKLIALCIKKESGAWLLGKIETAYHLEYLLNQTPEPNKTKLSTLCIAKDNGEWLASIARSKDEFTKLFAALPPLEGKADSTNPTYVNISQLVQKFVPDPEEQKKMLNKLFPQKSAPSISGTSIFKRSEEPSAEECLRSLGRK